MSRPLDAETDLAGASPAPHPPAPPPVPRPTPPPLFDGEAVEAEAAESAESVDVTTIDQSSPGPSPSGDDEQPTLPLDFGDPLVDPTLVDEEPSPDPEADTLFAEPRWRDSPR